MNKFNEREKSFEKKFVKDEELKFKLAARSNKYLGEWVSSELGKNEEEKKNYIQEIIKADMEEAGSEDVFRKVRKDFKIASISIEDSEIRVQMEKALSRAKDDFNFYYKILSKYYMPSDLHGKSLKRLDQMLQMFIRQDGSLI